jgi:hypothetical protein
MNHVCEVVMVVGVVVCGMVDSIAGVGFFVKGLG